MPHQVLRFSAVVLPAGSTVGGCPGGVLGLWIDHPTLVTLCECFSQISQKLFLSPNFSRVGRVEAHTTQPQAEHAPRNLVVRESCAFSETLRFLISRMSSRSVKTRFPFIYKRSPLAVSAPGFPQSVNSAPTHPIVLCSWVAWVLPALSSLTPQCFNGGGVGR